MTNLIIGAGLIGMTTAHALHRAGEEVTVVERGAAPATETSRANGSLLHPSLVEPWNSPGILKVLFRNLGREDAAVLLRLRALPALVGWGLQFLRHSSAQRHLANALRNVRLAQHSIECMHAIREDTAVDYSYYRRGSLSLYRDTTTYAGALRWYDELARHGLHTQVLEPSDVVAMDPALAPVGDRLVGATYAPDDESGDPHAFCVGLMAYLRERGVVFRFGESVKQFVAEGGRVTGAELVSGERLEAKRVILAAGSYSTPLASSLGLALPVRPVKGYSLTLPRGDSGTAPNLPVSDSWLHLAVVPVGEDRIRVAGTAEFTGFDRELTPARVANLQRLLAQLYPDYANALDGVDPGGWTGLRPMCPDGVPLIGASGVDGLFLNTGHGHTGWTLAAGSASLLADIVLGRAPAVAATDYAPGRFR